MNSSPVRRSACVFWGVSASAAVCLSGFVGLFNLLLLWPGFLLLHYTGFEAFELPSQLVWTYILINGLIGTVLSEFLWLWWAPDLLSIPVVILAPNQSAFGIKDILILAVERLIRSENTPYLKKDFDAAFSPQGLFPHIVSDRDSGIEPHYPALYYGRYLHAQGTCFHCRYLTVRVRLKWDSRKCSTQPVEDTSLKAVG